MTRRLFELQLRQRWPALVMLLLMTAGSLALTAAYVRPDFSVEYLFPERDRSRIDYDRYKLDFPYEDARALVVGIGPARRLGERQLARLLERHWTGDVLPAALLIGSDADPRLRGWVN